MIAPVYIVDASTGMMVMTKYVVPVSQDIAALTHSGLTQGMDLIFNLVNHMYMFV